ncbi:MAG: hypothetical protein A3J54_01965 [Candidatus Ryanbacteria bacterium RIFCSPHIGHO2_02_FULL_45_13b]|uniref:Uncharacterized protein n=1 Tax=Candidatus Ryanbacteria bacterium RIFCSPHIGHO2_02_FULL_45_13b TaxID=1802117 RepID=A0A1G2G9H9_9BACT|nr:MAG: hypothetical protein A3J54_01965 [Candidatus Ryanbacteria bacterium RIFCSPHIGHO2_02_FULL_45_13b]
MREKRVFLGVNDPQKIVLHPVFYRSPLVVISPVGAPLETYLYIEGRKDHLQFLFPYLVKLVKEAPSDPEDKWGTWTGVEGCSEPGRITLFYRHGTSLLDRMSLLEHHFRRDVVFYCGLRLANPSVLDVFCSGLGFHWHDKFILTGLPDELEQNGLIEFP